MTRDLRFRRNGVQRFSIAVLIATSLLIFAWFYLLTSEEHELTISAKEVFQNGIDLAQDDPRLLSFIKNHHLRPPSPDLYNLTHPVTDPSFKMGIRAFVHSLLGKKVGL